ncbi:PKD domain-containing protein [Conexibacter sp. W3-3-2]|uniref:PKD domain-containing protein n=1 Tax=Conexibacter sp. W3-3-2 TaxID=2675227 RepID=UPI0012B6FCE4|nr:PKD domain-containing protein [Conexibacter sp. W3-3-2]MTD45771.1 PKD domain-containing protein [Conexibacter sp. W3-3-2]
MRPVQRVVALATTLLAVLCCSPASAAGPTWQVETLSSPDGSASHTKNVSASDGTGATTVAWLECVGGRCDLFARTRSAGGTFGPERRLTGEEDEKLSNGSVDARFPIASNSAGDVVVAWVSCLDPSTNGEPYACRVRFAVKRRGTTTWTPAATAAAVAAPYGEWPTQPAVAINDEGDVTIAWDRHANADASSVVQAVTLQDENGTYAAGAVAGLSPSGGSYLRNENVVVTTRTDGTAVAAWTHYDGGCSTVRYATQNVNGSWDPPAQLNHGSCEILNAAAISFAITRDGDGVLATYSWSQFVSGSRDWSIQARTIGADDSLSAPQLVSDRRGLWNANDTAYEDDVRPLVTNAAGDAVLAVYADVPGAIGSFPDVLPTAFTRRDGVWTEHVLDPVNTTSAGSVQFVPGAALETDGTATVIWTQPQQDSGYRDVYVARHPRDGAWTSAQRISDPDDHAYYPFVSAGGDGPPVVTWWAQGPAGSPIRASVLRGTVNQAPTASFDYAPAAPVAGQVTTFTSTSTDADGAISDTRWDLDDDGDFDDLVGTTAQATFTQAGTYTVEVRVSDDGGETATASRQITVAPAPAGGGDGGPTPPGGSTPPPGGGGSGGGGASPPVVVTPPAPFGFVVGGTQDTAASRAMPAVVGRSLDDARDKVLRGVVYADVTADRVIRDAEDLPKRPGGGRWKVGEVIAQTPAAKSTHATSTTAQLAVRLQYWAGEKGDRSHCSALRVSLKQDDLDLALAQLKAAGCGSGSDLVLVPTKSAADPIVKSIAKDGDVTVNVPTDQSKLDIVTWRTSGVLSSTDPGPVADDFSLTAGQPNTFGVTLRDRAGRRVQGARVRIDLHEVGGSDVTRQTSSAGVTAATVTPKKAGTIHVLSEWADRSGERIYGYTSFRVRDRGEKGGFTTVTGRTYTWSRSSRRFTLSSAPRASAAGLPEFFAAITSCLKALGGQVAQLTGGATEQVVGATKQFGVSIMSLGRGTVSGDPQAAQVTRVTSGLWRIGPNGVVASGGGNVIAPGGANVVAAGGANVIAAGGLNLISDNGLGVIAPGGGNLITLPDGAKVIAPGGANVIAPGGLNLISDNGLGVIAAGGGNVIAAGGLN